MAMEDMAGYAKAAAYIATAFAISIGTLGPAIAQGLIGAKACENIGKHPESASDIRNSMFMALSFVETCSIYVTLISGALLWAASRL